MSFNRSFRAPSAMLAAVFAGLGQEQRTQDEAYGAAGGVTTGHTEQFAAAGEMAKSIADAHPDVVIVGSVSGHANEDRSGSVGISYRFEAVPDQPEPAAEPTTEGSAGE